MRSNYASPSHREAYTSGAVVLMLALATIAAAWGFEIIGKYIPCPLCLQQRWAYYAGIPLAFVALVLLSGGKARLSALMFTLVSLMFLANAGLGTYQAGAEWAWWPGPQTCGTMQAIGGAGGPGLLDKLDTTKVIKCDEAQWRFAGLSFAGWNVVVSLVLAAAALKAGLAAASKD